MNHRPSRPLTIIRTRKNTKTVSSMDASYRADKISSIRNRHKTAAMDRQTQRTVLIVSGDHIGARPEPDHNRDQEDHPAHTVIPLTAAAALARL